MKQKPLNVLFRTWNAKRRAAYHSYRLTGDLAEFDRLVEMGVRKFERAAEEMGVTHEDAYAHMLRKLRHGLPAFGTKRLLRQHARNEDNPMSVEFVRQPYLVRLYGEIPRGPLPPERAKNSPRDLDSILSERAPEEAAP